MQGKIEDCKSAFVVDENGNDIKISDRDEVNDLKGQISNLQNDKSSLNNNLTIQGQGTNSSGGFYVLDPHSHYVLGTFISNIDITQFNMDGNKQYAGHIWFPGFYITWVDQFTVSAWSWGQSRYRAYATNGGVDLYYTSDIQTGNLSYLNNIPLSFNASFYKQ